MMWRKQGSGTSTHDKRISGPVLIETSFDESKIDAMPTIAEVREERSKTPSPNPRELPRNPPVVTTIDGYAGDSPRGRPVSEVPTASSVYTQPSPQFRHQFPNEPKVLPLFARQAKLQEFDPTIPDLASQKRNSRIPIPRKPVRDVAQRINEGARGKKGLGIDTGVPHKPRRDNASGAIVRLKQHYETLNRSRSVSPIESTGRIPQFLVVKKNSQTWSETNNHGSHSPPSPLSEISSPVAHALPEHDVRQPTESETVSKPDPVSRLSWTTYDTSEPRMEESPSDYRHEISPSGTRELRVDNPLPVSRKHEFQTDAITTPRRGQSSPDARSRSPQLYAAGGPRFEQSPSDFRKSDGVALRIIHSQPTSPRDVSPQPSSIIQHYLRSPSDSPESLVDDLPEQSSIMTRPRPLPGRYSPLNGRSPASKTRSDGKELPLAPPAIASVDLVTSLRAQLDELQHRRLNLYKVIESLQIQPKNPMVQDLSKRRQTIQKRETFETELTEVRREEHELGLRLHRAWKRRDQGAPTSLWVRRVTG